MGSIDVLVLIFLVKFLFSSRAEDEGSPRLTYEYEELLRADREARQYAANHRDIAAGLAFLQEEVTLEQAHEKFNALLPYEEVLREELRAYLADDLLQEHIDTGMRADILRYVEEPKKYLVYQEMRQEELQFLFRVIQYADYLANWRPYNLKRRLLRYQIELATAASLVQPHGNALTGVDAPGQRNA